MAAGFLECVLAGLVPLLMAGALWGRFASPRPVPVRVSRSPARAAHRLRA
jgi:hypothetical protein